MSTHNALYEIAEIYKTGFVCISIIYLLKLSDELIKTRI